MYCYIAIMKEFLEHHYHCQAWINFPFRSKQGYCRLDNFRVNDALDSSQNSHRQFHPHKNPPIVKQNKQRPKLGKTIITSALLHQNPNLVGVKHVTKTPHLRHHCAALQVEAAVAMTSRPVPPPKHQYLPKQSKSSQCLESPKLYKGSLLYWQL